MMLLVLLLIFPTLDSHSNSFVSIAWPNDFTSLTFNVRLVTSLGQAIDTNELEWESKVGKINSKTLTHLYLLPYLMVLLVLLLILLTFESHSNSCVSIAWPNDFTSLTFKIIRSGSIYKWDRVRVKNGED
jgi:biotin-(acetyl-CoA carboxylase) ligase